MGLLTNFSLDDLSERTIPAKTSQFRALRTKKGRKGKKGEYPRVPTRIYRGMRTKSPTRKLMKQWASLPVKEKPGQSDQNLKSKGGGGKLRKEAPSVPRTARFRKRTPRSKTQAWTFQALPGKAGGVPTSGQKRPKFGMPADDGPLTIADLARSIRKPGDKAAMKVKVGGKTVRLGPARGTGTAAKRTKAYGVAAQRYRLEKGAKRTKEGRLRPGMGKRGSKERRELAREIKMQRALGRGKKEKMKFGPHLLKKVYKTYKEDFEDHELALALTEAWIRAYFANDAKCLKLVEDIDENCPASKKKGKKGQKGKKKKGEEMEEGEYRSDPTSVEETRASSRVRILGGSGRAGKGDPAAARKRRAKKMHAKISRSGGR